MDSRPRSSREFEARFPDDATCVRWLVAKRWLDSFRCPARGHDRGRELGRGVAMIECARCHRPDLGHRRDGAASLAPTAQGLVPGGAAGDDAQERHLGPATLVSAGLRTRLAVIGDYAAETLGGFVATSVIAGSTVVSDGWSGYGKLKDAKHDPKIVGPMAPHVVLPWVHRMFADAGR